MNFRLGIVGRKRLGGQRLNGYVGVVDEILRTDKALIKKQRHTAKRIFERLRDEHGYAGSLTTVTYYVREQKRRTKEVFVPLSHRPGHAQVDFGETLGVIGGVECKIHFFVMSLPHSDAVFVKGYPAETTEAFLRWPCVRLCILWRHSAIHSLRQYQDRRGSDTRG